MKYKKWRELVVDPQKINFKKINFSKIINYMPAGNDVLEIKTEENENYFLKIERSKMACFEVEEKHLKMISCEGLCVPEVIESGTVDGRYYIILSKINGDRLSELDFKKERNEYFYKWGVELSKIHNLDCSKFDNAKQRPINSYPDSDNYNGFEFDEYIKGVIEYLRDNEIDKNYNTFIHGDFHYANILWHENEISGIIDWEYSGKGFKEQDIAWTLICRPNQDFFDNQNDIINFINGYKMNGSFDNLKLRWCLVNGLVHFYIMNSDSDYRQKVSKLLNELINNTFVF